MASQALLRQSQEARNIFSGRFHKADAEKKIIGSSNMLMAPMQAVVEGARSMDIAVSGVQTFRTADSSPQAGHFGQWLRHALRFFRSASLRFAILHSIVFGVSAVLLSASLWYSTIGILKRQTESAVQADAQVLSDHFRQDGLIGLSATIRKRISENLDEHALYLLVDPQGNRIAGNLNRWPGPISAPHKWYTLPLKRYGIRMTAVYRFYPLPDHYQLLLGRDTRTAVKLQDVLGGALLTTLCAMIVLGMVGGIVIQTLFKRSLADMSVITQAISRGDLSKRVRRSGSGDEFDRLGATVNEILDRIAKLMDGVRQVSNAIAHDLRTPIARARSRLEDATLRAAGEEAMLAAIEQSIQDLDGIDRIFNALLRIAEIEAGARRSAFAEVDVTGLLDNLVEFYSAVAEEKEIVLQNLWNAPIFVLGDKEMIQQAIANLLSNAMKFAPAGSTVTLAACLNKTNLMISVSDQGPGIPEADRQRAVERFYRAEAARNTQGSGLGLALVAAVADLHNGTLRLEDNVPGLKAILTLPCRRGS